MTLEFLWRGRSHGAMFLLGGTCFLMLGYLKNGWHWIPLQAKVLLGASAVTALELLTGLVVNRNHTIWDYRGLPCQYRGQICLPFSLLWIPVSMAGMLLYKAVENRLQPKSKW